MRIGVAADHSALTLKEAIVAWLRKESHLTVDYGAHCDCPPNDFLQHALALAWAISRGTVERGILLSQSGVGAAVIANKISGVRAGFTHDLDCLRYTVLHDHLNVHSLWAAKVGPEEALELVRAFLSSPYLDDAPARRRLAKIAALESRFSLI